MENTYSNNPAPNTHFTNFLSSIRKIFRPVVLPVKKIKTICGKYFAGIDEILDFGSGTLFWTDWFRQAFNCTVYAVDPYYANCQNAAREKVHYYANINDCFEGHLKIAAIWACDVLHHLSTVDYENFLNTSIKRANLIIVKDIDMNHRFGNFMNRMHDKIINKENVINIDPIYISKKLNDNGFETCYHYLPKLWYPHFLLIGIKNKKS